MMAAALTILALILVAPTDGASSTIPTRAAARQAIDAFEPFPQPKRRNLGNVKVHIDWQIGTRCTDATNCTNRLAQTVGYLFHFVRDCGAVAVLSHELGAIVRSDTDSSASRNAEQLSTDDHAITVRLCCPHSSDWLGQQTVGDVSSEHLSLGLRATLPKSWVATQFLNPARSETASKRACDVWLPAIRVCDGTTWRRSRADALTLSDALGAYAVARGLSVVDESPVELPGRPRVRQIARQAHPAGPLPEVDVQRFCALFLRLAISNPSLTHTNITARTVGARVELSGATNVPFLATAVRDALAHVGVAEVDDRVRRLPDVERLGEARFGACRVAAALTRSKPNDRAGLQSELLFGEPVFLLDREGSFMLVQGGDGYWGWVREDAIARLTQAEFIAYLKQPEAIVRRDVVAGDVRVPRGARVRASADAGGEPSVALPGGAAFPVPRGTLAMLPSRQRVNAARRVDAALDLLHTPYVFGGRSPEGLDCSGLMTNISALCGGRVAARDASQQAFTGALTATAWFRQGLRAGDQVFFIDQSGKVYHTGIAISPTHILHAAPPGVRIGSIVRGDRLYDTRLDRDFFIAKRP